MSKWKCLNEHEARKHRCHFYFVKEGGGQYAVADWSMEGMNPERTDDGLLLLDKERPVNVDEHCVSVPVVVARDGRRSWVSSSNKQLERLLSIFRAAGMQVKVDKELARLVELLEPFVTTVDRDAWDEMAYQHDKGPDWAAMNRSLQEDK